MKDSLHPAFKFRHTLLGHTIWWNRGHLSDLHFGDGKFADFCRAQLETDLKQEFGIRRLEYLVISGDVANRSTQEEYEVAFAMVDGLVKRFGLDASRVVVVPGNHDLNWVLSEKAYPFVPKRKLPSPSTTTAAASASSARAPSARRPGSR